MTTNPTNRSFLPNNKFEFAINRLPNLVFFIQSINLPSLSLSTIVTPSPYVQIPKPGGLITFEQLTVNFILDEDLQSWFEIYNWMMNLGNPETLNKIGSLTRDPGKINSITSDASLLIKTNANNSNIKITYYDIFPTDLASVQLTSTEGQDFLTSSVTFTYTYYKAEKL